MTGHSRPICEGAAAFAISALSACSALSGDGGTAADRDAPISDRALSALPDTVNPEDVLLDLEGCYAYFDRNDKWVRPLTDSEGIQICD